MEIKMSTANRAIIEAFQKGYRCDDDGTIIKPDGRRQRAGISALGYRRFNYYIKGKPVSLLAHRFVMFCRVGDRLFTKGLCVLHKNDIGTDNSVKNLYLGTARDNSRDMIENNRLVKRGTYKLLYSEIYNYYLVFGQKKTCEKYGINQPTLINIKKKYKNAKHTTSSQISIPF